MDEQEDKEQKKISASHSNDDVENLFQEAIESSPQNELHEAKIRIKQLVGSVSSINYDENDQYQLHSTHLNDPDDEEDEDVLVVSQSVEQSDDLMQPEQIENCNVEDDDGGDNRTTSRSKLSIRQTHQTNLDDSQSLNFTPYTESESFERIKEESEEEASRRYLTINSAPLHRWSFGMLPSIPVAKHTNSEQRTKQNQANDSFGDDYDETNEIAFMQNVKNGSSIPVIVGGELTKNPSLKSAWINERLKHLAKAYNERGTFVKKAIENLPQSDDDSTDEDDEDEEKNKTNSDLTKQGKDQRTQLAIQIEAMFGDEWKSDRRTYNDLTGGGPMLNLKLFTYRVKYDLFGVFEPQSTIYIGWLFVVASAFLYNAIFILFRAVFPFEQASKTNMFVLMDIVADIIYLLDMIWFKTRLKFIKNGQWIDDGKQTRRHYLKTEIFRYDLLSTIPFDLIIFFYYGGYNVWPAIQRLSRLNRMLKINSFWEFFARIDATTNSPYLFRIIHTLLYKLYIIHLGACVYYLSSWYQGFGSTPWTYNNEGNAYLRCFYFSFRTTTSIGGRMPKPNNEFERVYMMIAWLLGVFVFAMVIGQIRDIVATAARNQNYYRDVLNKTANYMRVLNLAPKLQKRVRYWLNFTWELQKTFNENDILQVLPQKIRTDIALSVHYGTLSRVELFRNINRSVLRDLVLKLKPILFLPGDYICRKGEIGHEMYIVNKGKIQVMSGDDGRTVLATLGEGSVFGEIAILNLEGFTRRTADVRSFGYAQLFALRKGDLWETLKHYPEYQNVLRKKVQRILRKKNRKNKANKSNEDKINDSGEPNMTIKSTVKDNEQELKVNISSDDDDYGDLPVKGAVTEMIQVESIVKDRPKTPKLFNAVLEVIRPESTLNQYFSRSMSFSSSFDSTNQRSFDQQQHHENAKNENVGKQKTN